MLERGEGEAPTTFSNNHDACAGYQNKQPRVHTIAEPKLVGEAVRAHGTHQALVASVAPEAQHHSEHTSPSRPTPHSPLPGTNDAVTRHQASFARVGDGTGVEGGAIVASPPTRQRHHVLRVAPPACQLAQPHTPSLTPSASRLTSRVVVELTQSAPMGQRSQLSSPVTGSISL